MSYKHFSIFILMHLLCIAVPAQQRSTVSLNNKWLFIKSNSLVPPLKNQYNTAVNIPHTWNDKDVERDGVYGYYRGAAWYYKELDSLNLNNTYYLNFEGINQEITVFVNNKKAGYHAGGYTAFNVDITPYITNSRNTIAVRADNSHNTDIPPLSADFTFFGGIYRDINLVKTSSVHFDGAKYGDDGIYITTPLIKPHKATVHIKCSVLNTEKLPAAVMLSAQIINRQGNAVKNFDIKVNLKPGTNTLEKSIEVIEPDLWWPDDPYLYTVDLQIKNNTQTLDESSVHFGIRQINFDANKGFFINGQPVKLMGANRHQDYPGMGNALNDDVQEADLKLLKEMGANFVRLAHYPQDKAVLNAADRLGLLVWMEIPLVNEISLSDTFTANAGSMLIEMIRQNYNHPSIIIWGYMNEIYWMQRYMDTATATKHTRETVALAKKLDRIARQEDPLRYTAIAMHNYDLYEESGLGDIPQIAGWNLYNGWYYDEYEDFGNFLDAQHKLHPKRIHIASEFGAGGDPRLHTTKPERFDHTIEGQKRLMESFVGQILQRPYLAGAAVWNLTDFNSENRRDTQPHINNKGIMTGNRMPKDTYYLFQAYLLKEPFIKIAETNWVNRAATTAISPVDIYTNLDKAELFVNGKSVGIQKAHNKKITWPVTFKPGKNQLTVKGIDNYSGTIDNLMIQYNIIPHNINDTDVVDLHINCGSNSSFFDSAGNTIWIQDKPYSPGSWGYIGGTPLYVGGKQGSMEDFTNSSEYLPVFQTIQQGAESYKFDVKDGWYELELLLGEPYLKSRNFTVNNSPLPAENGGKRIFDVIVNDKIIMPKLDLLAQYGYSYAIRKKIVVKAINGKGITLAFKTYKGKSVISGIRLKNL